MTKIINKTEVKYTFSLTFIVLIIILIVALLFITLYNMREMKEISQIKYPDNSNNIVFYYSCPDYVSDYYNCNTTRFMNITGKYCGNKLTCENKYKILK